jgi:undecaprenyl-diphosphatase
MDEALLYFFNQTLAHPALDAPMIVLYFISNPTYHVPLLLVALFVKRWRGVAGPLLLTYVLTLAFTLLGQVLVGRPRPDPDLVRLIIAQPAQMSYPSGHSSSAFAFAMFVTLHWRSPRLAAVAFVWAVLTGIGRLYLAHHYPSDVLAGAVLGVCSATALHGFRDRARDATTRFGALAWLLLALFALATHMAYIGILPQHLLRWPFADKILHAGIVGALGFFLNLLLRGRRIGATPAPLAIALVAVGVAGEELLQALSPLRTFDLADLASDAAGLLLGWAASARLLRADQLSSPP